MKMTPWKKSFLWWPRRINGRLYWLRTVETRYEDLGALNIIVGAIKNQEWRL